MPVPWCENFSFNLNDIFTRLKIVSKEKTRGTLTDEITNLTGIFRAHKDCQKPRTVLIEGDPGMGKTTYCQKLAYDWATKPEEWDESFPEIEVLLLLRCHDIKSDIWEAIDDQLLPKDVDKKAKENFFEFIRNNQSKVLFVLDGLDETDSSKLEMYFNLVEGRVLPDCHIVLTSRHEKGGKVRRYCDNLWEIVGFTSRDAENFIYKYFKDMKHFAVKLIETMYDDCHNSADLLELRSNPLHLTLLCILCEDFEGVFPTKRTQLFMEIVRCILRRYEKNNKPSCSEDPLAVYKEELMDLGRVALQSLHEGEFCFEESKLRSTSTVLIKSGLLSIQTGGTRRKPCLRCGFLHRSFQEFFAGFYLAFQIADGKIDCDSVVNDERNGSELNQVFLFMSGIVALQCEETAVSFVKSLTARANLLDRTPNHEFATRSGLVFAFDFILECMSHNESIQSELIHTLGLTLELKTLAVHFSYRMYFDILFEALKCNTCLKRLEISENEIGDSGAAAISEALKVNTCLTNLNLSWNKIGTSGAAAISEALNVNTCLTDLNLSSKGIGRSVAAAIFEACRCQSAIKVF